MVLKRDIGQQKWQQMTQRWAETAIKTEKGANTIIKINTDSDMTSLTCETTGFDIQTRDIRIPQPPPPPPHCPLLRGPQYKVDESF